MAGSANEVDSLIHLSQAMPVSYHRVDLPSIVPSGAHDLQEQCVRHNREYPKDLVSDWRWPHSPKLLERHAADKYIPGRSSSP
jgi:hypothetical protein